MLPTLYPKNQNIKDHKVEYMNLYVINNKYIIILYYFLSLI